MKIQVRVLEGSFEEVEAVKSAIKAISNAMDSFVTDFALEPGEHAKQESPREAADTFRAYYDQQAAIVIGGAKIVPMNTLNDEYRILARSTLPALKSSCTPKGIEVYNTLKSNPAVNSEGVFQSDVVVSNVSKSALASALLGHSANGKLYIK